MNLIQYRQEIRRMLRDDSYPEADIDAAINRVIADINTLGRFRFHEASYALNLTAGNYTYPVPANVQAEKVFIYGNNEVPRRREMWTGSPMIPDANNNTGDTPTEWFRYANNWYIIPIPTATMAANDITVLYDKDLAALLSPLDTNALPDRHANVIIYGAVAMLRPGLLIGAPEGQVKIDTLADRALSAMREQENWNYGSIPSMRVSHRFKGMVNWGFRGRIR